MKHLGAVLTGRICLSLMNNGRNVFHKVLVHRRNYSPPFFSRLFHFISYCDQKSEIQNLEIIKMFAPEIAMHFPVAQGAL